MHIPAIRPLMNVLAAAATLLALSSPTWAEVTFYANDAFQGGAYTAKVPVDNLKRFGVNDRASSVVVRTDSWEICDDAGYKGRFKVLRPGQYPSLEAMGLQDRISSARPVKRNARIAQDRYAPAPLVAQDYRRRKQERVFEAPVTAVRAVLANSGQRCWVERQNVTEKRSDNRVGGAVLGAVIGGILGHQVGGGSGRHVATAGGAVAGAVVGSNLARNRDGTVSGTRDVQRCEATRGGAKPEYWDVTYRFRGQDHQVQLSKPPGDTVTVNRNGEPRA